MTMFDPRTKLSEQVVDEVRRFFGDLVYDNIIPRTVRLSEAPGFGVPITVYDPKSKGAQAYRDLAREVALRPPPDAPMATFDDVPTISVPNLAGGGPRASADATEDVRVPEDEVAEDEPATIADELRGSAEAPEDVTPASGPEGTTPAAAPEGTTPAAAFEPIGSVPSPAITSPAPANESSAPPIEADRRTEPPPTAAPSSRVVQTAPTSAPQQPDAEDEIWETPDAASKVRPVPQPPLGSATERRVVVIDENAELGGGTPPPKPGGSAPERTESIGATLHDDDGQRRRWRLFRKGGE